MILFWKKSAIKFKGTYSTILNDIYEYHFNTFFSV